MWQEIRGTIFHHLWWGIVAIVIAVLFFHRPVAPATPQVVVVPNPGGQTVARTVQGGIDTVRLVTQATGPAPAFTQPILNVMPKIGGISAAEMASWITALGRRPTTTAYSAYNVAPSPVPEPTLAPNPYLGTEFSPWHYSDTYNAVSAALKANTVHIDVTQVEIPPNRFGAVYLTDGAAGGVYALRRRKNVDLDIGLAKGRTGLEGVAGIGLNMPHTDAGLFMGVTLARPVAGLPKPSVGVQAGLVVHP